MKNICVVARGIRAPIIRTGDDLVETVVDSLLKASAEGRFEIQDRDVIGITESVVARAQGNYATVEQIAKGFRRKTGGAKTVGLVFPILSRNRFSVLLKGMSLGAERLVVQLAYPRDEVGNELVPEDCLDEKGINPLTDEFDEDAIRSTFGKPRHPFTGVDYVELYKTVAPNSAAFLSNDPRSILKRVDVAVACDIHSRFRTKRILKKAGAKIVLGLDDILAEPVDGSGYNAEYGLLGSNLADPERVKLFPRDCPAFASNVANAVFRATGKRVEAMVYGDGAFRDPAGKIWELADPVVSPGFTPGLIGSPNEVKLKYLADNICVGLSEADSETAIRAAIRGKTPNDPSRNERLGTTPRRLTDLLGSLCDLVSGSGDKGTPIVLIQNYFKTYADD